MFLKSDIALLMLTVILRLAVGSSVLQTPETTHVPETALITAANVAQLESVATIQVADLPDDTALASGWFTLSPDGTQFAAVTRENEIAIFDQAGLVETYAVARGEETATVLDARFSADGAQVASLHSNGVDFFLALHTLNGETLEIDLPARVAGEALGIPVRVWIGSAVAAASEIATHLWLETMPVDGGRDYKVVNLPLDMSGDVMNDDIMVIPSAPEQDTEAYVRIGRIPAPLAVTASQEGLVTLWDLETGAATYRVQVDDVPVFGRVNENGGEQLAWRDGSSLGLNVLDFESGQNTRVADLSGDYIQALMLTPAGDVVLAVHIGDENNVVAWIVSTGERVDLGTYRDCTGVPDMVQLSQDGTTLVIGCDLGFELWQLPASTD